MLEQEKAGIETGSQVFGVLRIIFLQFFEIGPKILSVFTEHCSFCCKSVAESMQIIAVYFYLWLFHDN